VQCPGSLACKATLDDAPITPDKQVFVRPGAHVASVEQGGAREQRRFEVKAGEAIEIARWNAPWDAPSSTGPSPVWFYVGLGLTAVAAGVTIASGVDTKALHDDFVAAGCPGPARPGDCVGLREDGLDAQTRTNVLAGVAGALGVATAVVGVFALGAKPGAKESAPRVSVEARGGGPFAKLILVLP